MTMRFRDRLDAGRQLADHLAAYAEQPDIVVRALARGGVPVAAMVADALRAPLDVSVVRKLGAPAHEEYAIGAIGADGIRVLNEAAVRALQLSQDAIDAITHRATQELLRREQSYRQGRAGPVLSGKTVILVDDGLATGLTMQAAIAETRVHRPQRVIVAVPVGSLDAVNAITPTCDACICLRIPEAFVSVGVWYDQFPDTDDAEVIRHLDAAADRMIRHQAEQAARKESAPIASHPTAVLTAPSLAVSATRHAVQVLGAGAQYLTENPDSLTPLLHRIGHARVVLIGEATHGTHEFYRLRAELTKRLITDHGFSAIAVEGDWPDAYRVNQFVRRSGPLHDTDAIQALEGFERFPQWMWRNADVLDFIGWLRDHNDALAGPAAPVGFYGLDLYSLHASMAAVIAYLDTVDPEAAHVARERYACFDHVGLDPLAYGRGVRLKLSPSCERETLEQLRDLQQRSMRSIRQAAPTDTAALFAAEQNARVVRHAEQYYRGMFDAQVNTWNLRDRHMMSTLQALRIFLDRQMVTPSKLVVWAHNSHVGDARATAMTDAGEVNLGQLSREAWGSEVALVGFSTFSGTVTAATDWDAPCSRMAVRPALPESLEWLLHEVGAPDSAYLPARGSAVEDALLRPRLARAIGVIYRPHTERESHYYRVSAARQFDALIHIDRTRAVEPLEAVGLTATNELPDTYPTSL